MGAGFYLTIAFSAVMFQVAEKEKRNPWIWSLSCFTTGFLIMQFLRLDAPAAFMAFFLNFVVLWITNKKDPSKRFS